MDSHCSVTQWLVELKHGDEVAAEAVVGRYLERLIRVGRVTYRNKFNDIPRPAEDEEDAALSALDSLFEGVRAGKFPKLHDRDSLWRLLVKITVRKVFDQRERALAKKRGGGDKPDSAQPDDAPVSSHADDASHLSSDLTGGDADEAAPRRKGTKPVEQVVDDIPEPQVVAEIADTYRAAMASLDDPQLQQIAEMDLVGKTREEIAQELGTTERTVYRKLEIIRDNWDARFADLK